MVDSNKNVSTSHLKFSKTGKLSEFRFQEPFSSPVASPINLYSTTLASTFILASDVENRTWINAAVRWFNNFTTSGIATVTFTLLRDSIPIYTINQSVFNPLSEVATVSNVLRLQNVDYPNATALTPVVYTLQATTTVNTAFSTGPITLSAAEIRPNSFI